ncbi:integrase, catalytic region, zinc finger, CCHC-type containing protein [Tanacetum coccineum]|uniref:Integrase, catalytic region, zinc finger, CCHC-type containing protein n=1 Tax=Tanacetum coccineum TaxID=301880 RepID=A0ABQ5BAS7_9ASTR
MSTLAKFMIVAAADNRPPMLDKPQYLSWKIHMELYIQGKDNGRIILNSVENGPFVWPIVALENDTVRPKTYEELSDKGKLQTDCDLKATNIVLQGLPPDVYALINHFKVAKDIWDRVKLLMQGTSLSKQERECKLYDEFDKFSYVKGEHCHQILTFAYVEEVLEQHEVHANETRLMRERFSDPLALVANFHQQPSHFNNYHSQYTTPHHTQPSVTQNAYPPPTIPQQPQAEFSQIDSVLVVPSFLPGDDPIACVNKAMAFLSVVFTPRSQGNASRGNTSGQVKVIKCYNCQGEGHMARQCTQPKRRRDVTWFKEKILLVQAHAEGKELDEEQFLDAYDSDCDDICSAKEVLMANLSSCDSNVCEHRNLATYFMEAMEEGRVMSILDPLIFEEGSKDQLMAIANLAMRCLSFNGVIQKSRVNTFRLKYGSIEISNRIKLRLRIENMFFVVMKNEPEIDNIYLTNKTEHRL